MFGLLTARGKLLWIRTIDTSSSWASVDLIKRPCHKICIFLFLAENLLQLLQSLGQAYAALCQFECRKALQLFSELPSSHYHTGWVLCQIGRAHFEMAEYEKVGLNSLTPGRCKSNFELVIFIAISRTDILNISCEIPSGECHKTFWWLVSIGLGNGLVQSGDKPLTEPVLPYGITRPQGVNSGSDQFISLKMKIYFHCLESWICNYTIARRSFDLKWKESDMSW